jgi:hypothetical protein
MSLPLDMPRPAPQAAPITRPITRPLANRTPSTDQVEVARDLQATLEARRELGSGYDEHFIESLVERLTQTVDKQEKRRVVATPPSHEQRLGLAITSMALLIPLVAIALGMGLGFAGLVVVCLTILAINLGFRFL